MSTPEVTVLMPVYNAEACIREAVESILAQTFHDFECLLINDGSTDSTPAILEEYAHADSRVRIEHNVENLKIAKTLNKGIALAQAPLVARMDSDDVSLPERLELQVSFMRANPDVAVCGTALQVYGSDVVLIPPLENGAIRAGLFFESCLYHPSVIYKKSVVHSLGYQDHAVPAEDYDLWARLAVEPSVRFHNLEQILLRYRVSTNARDTAYKNKQTALTGLAHKRLLLAAGVSFTDSELALHQALARRHDKLSIFDLWACRQWMTKLYPKVTNSGLCEPRAFREELITRWRRLFRMNRRNPLALGVYLSSEFGGKAFPFRKFLK